MNHHFNYSKPAERWKWWCCFNEDAVKHKTPLYYYYLAQVNSEYGCVGATITAAASTALVFIIMVVVVIVVRRST